jgi:hypothetical protein
VFVCAIIVKCAISADKIAALPGFGQWYFRMLFKSLPFIAVTWMASFLHLVGDENLQFMDYRKDLVERLSASYSLLSLLKS